MLGSSCLDEETVTSFVTFVRQNLAELVKPTTIPKTKKYDKDVYKHVKKLVMKDVLRVDILATLCTRLINHLLLNDISPTAEEVKNIQTFIKMDFLPNDLRLSLLQDVVSVPKLKSVMADPDVALLLLEKM